MLTCFAECWHALDSLPKSDRCLIVHAASAPRHELAWTDGAFNTAQSASDTSLMVHGQAAAETMATPGSWR